LQTLTEIERLLIKTGARKGWNEAEFIHAARNNDLKQIQDLIGEGVDVNIRDTDGGTALLIACQKADLKLCQVLIDHGASVDVRNQDDRTPLMEAARQKQNGMELVKQLYQVDPNLDLNAQDKQGETALLEAARAGQPDIVQFLVERDANVNAANHRGETPIIEMAAYPDIESVDTLLKQGANACAHDSNHNTAISQAAKNGHLSILELLLGCLKDRLKGNERKREIIINAIDDKSCSAVDWAANGGYDDCVKLLREHGCKSASESDFAVYTTPHGDHYHRYTCSSIGDARENGRLKHRPLRTALRLHYEFCDLCKPDLETVDWSC